MGVFAQGSLHFHSFFTQNFLRKIFIPLHSKSMIMSVRVYEQWGFAYSLRKSIDENFTNTDFGTLLLAFEDSLKEGEDVIVKALTDMEMLFFHKAVSSWKEIGSIGHIEGTMVGNLRVSEGPEKYRPQYVIYNMSAGFKLILTTAPDDYNEDIFKREFKELK